MTQSMAAVAGNFCICPVCDPKPHVGGAIIPSGNRTVIINGMPAAIVGDIVACAGPPPHKIQSGSATVQIQGQPASRLGDSTSHGGKVIMGSLTVFIG